MWQRFLTADLLDQARFERGLISPRRKVFIKVFNQNHGVMESLAEKWREEVPRMTLALELEPVQCFLTPRKVFKENSRRIQPGASTEKEDVQTIFR